MSLTAKQILEMDDRPTKEVEVPEWGGSVFIRTMSGDERDTFEAEMVAQQGGANPSKIKGIRARFVTRVLVDENGERLFKDSQADQLGKKSAAALDRIFSEASAFNRLSGEDVEELAGN